MTATAPAGVSVVIPHYGSPEPTRDLLRDLRGQRTPRPVEVIVVDDASPEPFPRLEDVTVIRRAHNGGFGSTVNSGVQIATQPVLLILNSDLRLDADFVESIARRAERWSPAVVGPRLVDPRGTDQHGARRFPRITHQVVEWLTPLARARHRPLLQSAVGYDLGGGSGGTRRVDWLVGAALCLPTSVFREMGGFDEGYFMNCEEVDLQLRLNRRGIPSLELGDLTVTHIGGASSSTIANRRRWVVSARRRYAAKWGGLRRLQAALTAATCVNLAWNSVRRLLGRPVDPAAAMREELRLIWGPSADLASQPDAAQAESTGND